MAETENAPDASPEVSVDEVRQLLSLHHQADVEALEALTGGFWSSAFGYRIGDDDRVLRLSDDAEGFQMDRDAHRFASATLPVPEVFHIGEWGDRFFAISERRCGTFLEEAFEADPVHSRTLLGNLFGGLATVPSEPTDPVSWFPTAGEHSSDGWQHWLLGLLADDPSRTVSGWRPTLAADSRLDTLFNACEDRMASLLDACPERRDLIHGDTLHRNVLVDPSSAEINAVFSWKCSVRGDLLYDLALCTFWEPWFPGLEAADPWTLTGADGPWPQANLVDAELRHHCYELHIGAHHLAFHAWTGRADELDAVAKRTAHILERGPRLVV